MFIFELSAIKIHTMDAIENFYLSCINCKNTKNNCPGIWKDKKEGVMPKGFFYWTTSPKIFIVGKNPGHPLPTETDRYKDKSDFDILIAHKRLVKEVFNDSNLKTTFHKNVNRYVRFFLDLSSDPQISIFDYVSYTNLVKCSTEKETGRISTKTIQNCFTNYFVKEIELFKPKVILALGGEVKKFLAKQRLSIPIISVKHPSYYYKKEDELKILSEIKERLKIYIP